MELGLVKKGDVQITQSGAVYLRQVAETLHRVRKFKMCLVDGTTMELTYAEFNILSDGLMKPKPARFIRLRNGEMVAVNQIKSIKPYETIVDVRKEQL